MLLMDELCEFESRHACAAVRRMILKGRVFLTVPICIAVRNPMRDSSPRERDAMRYTIDGEAFDTLAGFLDTLDATLTPGAKWSRDLDGLNRILRSDGQEPSQGMTLVWRNSEKSRADLSYAETLRVLEAQLPACDAMRARFVHIDMANARKHVGPTVYDWVIEVIERHGPGGDEGWDNITLELD
jgi:RNAse (barnase) inhibitor barstar